MERLLRCGVLLVAIGAGGACEGDDAGAYACGPPADRCLGRLCITEIDGFSYDDCCDSEVCNCNPRTKQWETQFCDPPLALGPEHAAPIDAACEATEAGAEAEHQEPEASMSTGSTMLSL